MSKTKVGDFKLFVNPAFNVAWNDYQNSLQWFDYLPWNDPSLDSAILNVSSTERQLEATYLKSKNEFESKKPGFKFKWQK